MILFLSEHKDILESLDNFTINISNQKVLLKDVVEFIKIPAYSQIFKENNEQIIKCNNIIIKYYFFRTFEKIEIEIK